MLMYVQAGLLYGTSSDTFRFCARILLELDQNAILLLPISLTGNIDKKTPHSGRFRACTW